MPISELRPPAIDTRKLDRASADSNPEPAGDNSYGPWLMWLQSLLQAHSLILYRVDSDNSALRMKALACVPGVAQSAGSAYSQVAIRCAKSRSVVRAISHSRKMHSVVCLPDVVSCSKLARHVLLVERRSPTQMDEKTQTSLVSWAFKSLHRYSVQFAPLPQENYLSQWLLARSEHSGTLSVAMAQLMDQLVKVTGSERCLVAQLRLHRNTVRSADLVALSGQQHINSRLPASGSLVIGIEETYCNKKLPLVTNHQPLTNPSITSQTPITTALEQCSRLIVPVFCNDCWYAISLERSASQPFGETEQAYLERDLGLALTLLVLSDPQARTVITALKHQMHRRYIKMVACVPRTMAIGSLCLITLLYLLLPAEYRVSAPLSIEASERHVLIAPVDGFVESVSVKAGDSVKKGQVLATLDDLDLQLQQQKLRSELRQNQQVYAKALALHDRVDVTRLKEEASHIRTELSQLDLQRERMVLVAPVDGVVLSGSWDDFLGAAVSSGDALFTLGSTSSHRLVLNVSEYDVRKVQPGQPVGIRMSADPSEVLLGRVTAIMPLAVARDGGNSVQVHAALDQHVPLRPGMQGLGKVLVGTQARVGQWLGRATMRLVWLGWRLGVLK